MKFRINEEKKENIEFCLDIIKRFCVAIFKTYPFVTDKDGFVSDKEYMKNLINNMIDN